MPQKYAPEELTRLLFELNSDTPLEEIATKLNRSQRGVALKLQKLSDSDPTTWNPEKTRLYAAKMHSDNWKAPKKQQDRVEQARQKVLRYLRGHPNADAQDFEKDGVTYDLSIAYDSNRINAARRDLGLEGKHTGGQPKLSKKQRKQRLLDYLKEHPNATVRNINNIYVNDIRIVYGNIDDARRDAGIVPVDYISAAQAGRELGVTRERVSQLFENHQLNGYRLGRRLYISSVDVKDRKDVITIIPESTP